MPRQSPLWYNVVEMLKSITIFTPLPVPLSSGLLLEQNLLMVQDRNRTMSSLVLEDMLSLVLAQSHTGLLLSLAVWPSQLQAPLDSPPPGGVVLWLKEIQKERSQTAWVRIPALPCIGCVALGKLLNCLTSFCLNFFNCKMGLMMLPTLIGLPWGLNELHVQHFKQCCTWNQYF